MHSHVGAVLQPLKGMWRRGRRVAEMISATAAGWTAHFAELADSALFG